MERMKILKDYVMYCYDLKLDPFKKATKIKYINAAARYFVKINGIKDLEKKQKEIENILKYNTLTINKLKIDHENDLKKLPF